MIKDDEAMMFFMFKGLCGQEQKDSTSAKDIMLTPGFPIDLKRAENILLKWTDRGWWNYGVSSWCGWMEAEAYKWAIIDGEIIPIGEAVYEAVPDPKTEPTKPVYTPGLKLEGKDDG